MPLGLDSNPGEGVNVCKYIVPSIKVLQNSCRATSPLAKLVKGEEWWGSLVTHKLGAVTIRARYRMHVEKVTSSHSRAELPITAILGMNWWAEPTGTANPKESGAESCHHVDELWFQQDGATCHTARATIDLLKDTFGDRLISRFEPVNWPPRSCDLTTLDYFLWVYVMSLVYADKPQTLDHLEDNIRRVIAYIRPQMVGKSHRKLDVRLDYIRASRDSPMPEIIFKM
ncbi:DUF4817 domain-containing protein [Trichonephila clavipes]|nr:DUF4817 domain-containing protein [Trichonephila clavipes]